MRRLFLFVLAAFTLVSCEKVVEVDIKDSEMRYVVEGVISDEPNSCRVSLSKTKQYFENNSFDGVSGAVVKMTDNGVEYTLTETSPGVYTSNAIQGIPGHVYGLSVAVDGKLFTATSTMHQPVSTDFIFIGPGPLGRYKFVTFYYTDPAGTNNGYRFIQYVNGVKDPVIFWDNDEFTDGLQSTIVLDNGVSDQDSPRTIHSGDEVMVEIQSLDDPVYRFWSTLATGGADGSGFTASPANPVTNMKGGALGYFSAHATTRTTTIAP